MDLTNPDRIEISINTENGGVAERLPQMRTSTLPRARKRGGVVVALSLAEWGPQVRVANARIYVRTRVSKDPDAT